MAKEKEERDVLFFSFKHVALDKRCRWRHYHSTSYRLPLKPGKSSSYKKKDLRRVAISNTKKEQKNDEFIENVSQRDFASSVAWSNFCSQVWFKITIGVSTHSYEYSV